MAFRSESLIYAELSEWFKEHDWKSCVGLKPTGGSNPLLCAKNTGKRRKNSDLALFFRFFLFTEIFNKILLPSSLPLFISLLGIG